MRRAVLASVVIAVVAALGWLRWPRTAQVVALDGPFHDVVAAPARLGDFWEWQLTDRQGLDRLSQEVVATGPDGSVMMRVDGPPPPLTKGPRQVQTLPFLDPDNAVHAPFLDFPLQDDKRWTRVVPAPGGTLYTTRYQVRGRERVRLPAGEFDCVRIDSQMVITVPGGGGTVSPESLWYCPAVHVVARREAFVSGAGIIRHELVRYRLAPESPAARQESSPK